MAVTYFSVRLKHEPGALAELASRLAEKGIDIRTLACGAVGTYGCAVLSVSNDSAAREVFRAARYQFVEGEAFNVGVEDRPGALAQLAGRLGEAGVNISGVVLLGRHQGKAELAITVDSVDKARRV
ncbi:MAG: ACT domain-containing protein, partial [Chloroflexi bacterium]|nr:ACT domain-containing protein [Chloroflexota bacterium]